MRMDTPRWGSVEVTRTFKTRTEAALAGFNEPTGRSDVRGKLVDCYADENGHGWSKFEWALIEEASA